MVSRFRVRFAGTQSVYETTGEEPRLLDHPNRRRKSRFGCQECKKRHLKCDETFPVCLRCKRAGVTCRSVFRSVQWQLEVPAIERQLSNITSAVDRRLLQYWLEKASQVMVIDPNNNPFSFGILKYFETSPSLIHTVQALSLAHENFFTSLSLEEILQEKDHALRLVQEELRASQHPAHGSLLTVLFLGLCSAWVYRKPDGEFGKEHLHGARAILDILLNEPGSEDDPFVQQAVATYLGWDQATAFILDSNDQLPLESEGLLRCVAKMRNQYNPTIGYTIEVMYLLGNVGRYCRAILDGAPRDIGSEIYYEEQLLQFQTVDTDLPYHVNNAYRRHGLIMLYRAIQSSITSDFLHSPTDWIDCSDFPSNEIIRYHAKQVLADVEKLPEASYYHSFLSLPLFTAASELTKDDSNDRQGVRRRFQKLFSLTRLPVNLCAIEFLEELWTLYDNGYQEFWLTYLLEKSWVFILC